MRFVLVVLLLGSVLVWASYFSVVSEHSVLTQIDTSIASPDDTRTEDADDSNGSRFFNFGEGDNKIAAFDIAGDADEIGFNCPFGIEALNSETVSIIDPSADRLLQYTLSADEIISVVPLSRPDGYDVVAAVSNDGTLYIGERSLAGRGDTLRTISFAGGGVAHAASIMDTDTVPKDVIDKLISRGYEAPQSTQTDTSKGSIGTLPDNGSITAASANGAAFSVNYEITNKRFLKLIRQLPSGETTDVVVRARRPIGALRLVQVNDNGDIYLSMTEELRRINVFRSDETIIKISADANEDVELYYVPRSRVCTPRQTTTILSNGDVVSIFVRRNNVSLVQLKPKGQWQWRLRTARDTAGVFLMEKFRNNLKPVDLAAVKYPDFASKLPPKPTLPIKKDKGRSESVDEPDTSLGIDEEEDETTPIASSADEASEASSEGNSELNTALDEAVSLDSDETTIAETLGEDNIDQSAIYAEALEQAFVRVATGEKIDRRSVVNNACMYLNLKYTMRSENYEPDTAFHYGEQSTVTDACASRGNYNLAFWSRPSRLSGQLGEEVTSAPYVWAGSDWPWQFVNKIEAGRPAGDVCTKVIIYDAKSTINSIYSAGVDCSGFVSRSWGGNSRYTTRSIPDAATEITFEELQPGDVLNKAGNHVVMFLYWRGAGEMEIIEATTNKACGGVCSRTRKVDEFQGYKAYRPNHIEDGGAISAAEVQNICQSATVTALD